ncbi:hypothetical protein QBC33DRAFT_520829 [Phialemonium atrogriseum]|uniref:Box C/D snoRNA protein 1 n=1 Tax=Phialemonium atrogriseum TaxID=1093897 RepID=A0AAJ0FL63_9PEZI|nr:uncharacterized protein QBC33DRAFT_520829 [Phialemonium atrogriseum]KAK1772316.1 hypothetical protein QBC33DRAFT_520829 [Phialemonium atrogriseum]
MSDPLLTALCSICHVEAPKYKCPRCGARTCSLACVRKHKAWASCSGERDPAAFVPRAQLCSDAGVDHDYNFISSIERARDRFEKEVTSGGRGLLTEKDIRGPEGGGDDKRFEKVWYGDQLHHVPTSRGRGGGYAKGRGQGRPGDDGRSLGATDKHIRRRLRAHDIEVLLMPKGLLRQRQNKTAWNRRTNTINWQVEWLVFSSDVLDLPAPAAAGQPVQILHKALDEKPLYQAFSSSIDWYRAGIKRARENDGEGAEDDAELPPRKKQKTPRKKQVHQLQEVDLTGGQDPESTAWTPSEYTLQYSLTAGWNQTSTAGSVPITKEEQEAELATLRFFLLKQPSSNGGFKQLIPLSSRGPLSEALSGRTVVEFPTVYVLNPTMQLPAGFALASTERRERRPEPPVEEEHGERQPPRRGRPFEGRRGGRPPLQSQRQSYKRVARPRAEDAEEGEVNSEGEQVDVNDTGHMADSNHGRGGSADVGTDSSDDGSPQPETSKASQGLVDYDSSGDSE